MSPLTKNACRWLFTGATLARQKPPSRTKIGSLNGRTSSGDVTRPETPRVGPAFINFGIFPVSVGSEDGLTTERVLRERYRREWICPFVRLVLEDRSGGSWLWSSRFEMRNWVFEKYVQCYRCWNNRRDSSHGNSITIDRKFPIYVE